MERMRNLLRALSGSRTGQASLEREVRYKGPGLTEKAQGGRGRVGSLLRGTQLEGGFATKDLI